MFCTECGVQVDDAEICPVCHPPVTPPAPPLVEEALTAPLAAPMIPLAGETLTAPQQVEEIRDVPAASVEPEYVPPTLSQDLTSVDAPPPETRPDIVDPVEPQRVREQPAPAVIELGQSPATSAIFGGQTETGMAPPVTTKVKDAALDATKAFATVAINPVGGLPAAYERLGPSRALGAGIFFAVVAVILIFIGIYVGSSPYERPDLADTFKFFFFGTLPFLILLGTSAVTRKFLSGAGSIHGDCFIAGATLLPLGLLSFVIGLLGLLSPNLIAVLTVFALCFTIFTLYIGLTRISMVAETRAAWVVPIMIAIAFLITQLIFNSVVPTMLPSPGKIFGQ
jgi:hypothetical protein